MNRNVKNISKTARKSITEAIPLIKSNEYNLRTKQNTDKVLTQRGILNLKISQKDFERLNVPLSLSSKNKIGSDEKSRSKIKRGYSPQKPR